MVFPHSLKPGRIAGSQRPVFCLQNYACLSSKCKMAGPVETASADRRETSGQAYKNRRVLPDNKLLFLLRQEK
jgi:hypothetical protein